MSDRVQLKALKRLHIRLGDATVVDTTRAYAVFETGLPPRYYAPRDEVRAEVVDTPDGASCPWKGKWHHVDLVVDGRRVPTAAWTYYETTPVCAPIQGFLAFYAQKFDVVETA